jgi:hypothetical protein
MSAPPTLPLNWKPEDDYNAFVHFLRNHVQPPARVYVTRDDVLELLAWVPITTTTVNLSLRFMAPNGEVLPRFEQLVAASNGATPRTKVLQNAEGFLLSASVETPGATRGQCFVALRVRRGGGSADITQGEYILQGYPGSVGGLGYPWSPLVSPLDGRGRVRSFAVVNPAAGADWSQVVPAGVQWIIRGVVATLTTAVAVATRQAALEISDATPSVVLVSTPGLTQIASLVDVYSWFNGAITAAAGPQIAGGLPNEFRLPAGWKFGTVTANIAAADQWSSITVAVEEFIGG